MAYFEDEMDEMMLRDAFEDDEDEEEVPLGEGRQDPVLEINIDSWKRLGDPTFHEHFRMDRKTFDRLLLAVGRHLENQNRILRRSKNEKGLDFSLMMVLWVLATPDTFRSVGTKFGVSKGVVHYHYKYIIEALREMAPTYIRWPSALEKERISAEFEDRYGYPSVAGCMDGCLIRVTAPLEQPAQYIDWHRQYSINVQAVCDDNLQFIDVYVGEPGSIGDKRTFRRSPLGQNILKPEVMSDKILLADGGYTLMSNVMIPYRDNGNMTPRMRAHNYYLSRCRASIERSFALLKNKWRRLKFFPSYCIEYAVDHIMSCLVLHNFIILQGRECKGPEFEQPNMDPNYQRLMRQARVEGVLRRDAIAAMLDPR